MWLVAPQKKGEINLIISSFVWITARITVWNAKGHINHESCARLRVEGGHLLKNYKLFDYE